MPDEPLDPIRAGYVLADLDALQKADGDTIHAHMQSWADGPDGLRKSVAASFMAKAKKAAAEKPGAAVSRWSRPGAVPAAAGLGAAEQAKQGAQQQMDVHARRFAHVARKAAVWGASLGAAAALANQKRGLQPRNALTGAPVAATGAAGNCPTCGQAMPLRKNETGAVVGGLAGLALGGPVGGLAGTAIGASFGNGSPHKKCPTCGQAVAPAAPAMAKGDGLEKAVPPGRRIQPRIEPEAHPSPRLDAPTPSKQWVQPATRGQLVRAKIQHVADLAHGQARVAGRQIGGAASSVGRAVARRPVTSLLAAGTASSLFGSATNSAFNTRERAAPFVSSAVGGIVGAGIGRALHVPGLGAAFGANYGATTGAAASAVSAKLRQARAAKLGGFDNSKHPRNHGKFASKGAVAKYDGDDVLEPLAKAGAAPRMSRTPHNPDAPLVPGQDPTDRSGTGSTPGHHEARRPRTQAGPGFTPHNAETGATTHATSGKASPRVSENPSTPDKPMVPGQEPTVRRAKLITVRTRKSAPAATQAGPGFTPRNAETGKLSGKKNARKTWAMSAKAQR